MWYGQTLSGRLLSWLFWPLSLLFAFISKRRRNQYWNGEAAAYHAPLPVIVVGNISVGGTGKSPVTIWLIEQLQQRGFKPGVVSRGYGGNAANYPHCVSETDDASVVGDEPLMIHLRSGVPVVVDPNRTQAVKALLAEANVDVVISDDGLQHYPLSRTFELAVVDGQRGVGNGNLLPMGPLREPVQRLEQVDAVVVNSAGSQSQTLVNRLQELQPHCFTMQIQPGALIPFNAQSDQILKDNELVEGVASVAGIGNPERFFQTLDQLGIKHQPKAFDDHHDYSELDLEGLENQFIVTTEKDAVKLRRFSHLKGAYLPISAQIQDGLIDVIIDRLNQFTAHHQHRY